MRVSQHLFWWAEVADDIAYSPAKCGLEYLVLFASQKSGKDELFFSYMDTPTHLFYFQSTV